MKLNHPKIIHSLLSGDPLEIIAQQAHIKPATLHSLFLNPDFRQSLDAAIASLDAELLSLALNQLRSLLSPDLAKGESGSRLQPVAGGRDHQDPKILLSAIETVLKRDLALADKRPSACSNEPQTVIWKWADEPVPPSNPTPDP